MTRMVGANFNPEWAELPCDFDRRQEVGVAHESKRFILRIPITGIAGKVFQATRLALPPTIREAEPETGPASPACRQTAKKPENMVLKPSGGHNQLKQNIFTSATVQGGPIFNIGRDTPQIPGAGRWAGGRQFLKTQDRSISQTNRPQPGRKTGTDVPRKPVIGQATGLLIVLHHPNAE